MFREKEDNVNLDLACEAVLDRASEHNLVVCSTNGQCAGSNVVALEPLDRTHMKNTALSASMDMAASLAFRKLLK